MINKKNQIKSLKFIFLVLLFYISLDFLSSQTITVTPLNINCGEKVEINVSKAYKSEKYILEIITPIGKSYYYDIVEDTSIEFTKTGAKGFLTNNWNEYTVYLKNSNSIIDEAHFYLKPDDKELYFTVYVDDVGEAGCVSENDCKCFKSIGGKLNIGYQYDDWGGYNLKQVKREYPNDYIFHHFHAQQYGGPKVALMISHIISWKKLKIVLKTRSG